MGVLVGLLVVVFACGGMFMSIIQLYDTESQNKKLFKDNIILEQTNNELKLELEECCECSATSTDEEIATSTNENYEIK